MFLSAKLAGIHSTQEISGLAGLATNGSQASCTSSQDGTADQTIYGCGFSVNDWEVVSDAGCAGLTISTGSTCGSTGFACEADIIEIFVGFAELCVEKGEECG